MPSTSAIAVFTYNTPTVALADRFAELFDVIAERFEFVWDDGPAG